MLTSMLTSIPVLMSVLMSAVVVLRTQADQSICKSRFDSVLRIADDIFYFRKQRVWLFSNNRLVERYPTSIVGVLDGGPQRIDASVYSPKTGNVYFFRNTKVFRYKYDSLNSVFYDLKTITKFRRNRRYPKPIDYAFMGTRHEIYLVKNRKTRNGIQWRYWKITEKKMEFNNNVYRLANIFPMSKNLEASAAYRMPGGKRVVLFSKNKFLYITDERISHLKRIFTKRKYPQLCK